MIIFNIKNNQLNSKINNYKQDLNPIKTAFLKKQIVIKTKNK